MNQANLDQVDWSSIPVPVDDGATAHLEGTALPPVSLPATTGEAVEPGALTGWTVLYFYPMTGRPGTALPDGWDDIPGARGCTPQSCAFRDHADELAGAGVSAIYGVSTQGTDYQREAAQRLHLPFALLSDAGLELAGALKLPTMEVAGMTLIRRLTLILQDGVVRKVFYPVFPPDRNAADVVAYMKSQTAPASKTNLDILPTK